MTMLYNFDGVKTELEKTIHREKAFFKAWENVKYPTKKDGTPFVNMSKNFDGATYRKSDYTLQDGENEIVVMFWDDRLGYIKDTISCYELVKYLKDENKKQKTENYMPKQTYLEQVYKYDVEDVKKAIQDRIEYFKKEIEKNEKDLKQLDKLYYDFQEKYKAAVKELEENCNSKTVYYNIKETICKL